MSENRQTWLVELWLGNSQSDHLHWSSRASELLELVHDDKDDAVTLLAEEIEMSIGNHPLSDNASLYCDFLDDALRQVDWQEVASSFLEE